MSSVKFKLMYFSRDVYKGLVTLYNSEVEQTYHLREAYSAWHTRLKRAQAKLEQLRKVSMEFSRYNATSFFTFIVRYRVFNF